MTPQQQLAALFAQLPIPGGTLPALARDVLALAARAGDLVLPGPAGPGDLVGLHPRLLRPFLAALGHAAAAAAGAEFHPYDGEYTLNHPGGDGAAVRLRVRIENTPGVQRFEITRLTPAVGSNGHGHSTPVAAGHLDPIA